MLNFSSHHFKTFVKCQEQQKTFHYLPGYLLYLIFISLWSLSLVIFSFATLVILPFELAELSSNAEKPLHGRSQFFPFQNGGNLLRDPPKPPQRRLVSLGEIKIEKSWTKVRNKRNGTRITIRQKVKLNF